MEKIEFTLKKTTVECYKIRHESGMYWADITLDSLGSKGRISISSDYGNYANFWGACGSGGFKKFLTDLNIEYAADKFGADRWFDLDGTIKGYKVRVLECRRDESIDAELARELFNEIKELEECSHENQFVAQMWNCRKLMRFFDGCPDIDRNITPQFRKFWKTVWPIFLERLKVEIEQENKEVKDLQEVKEVPVRKYLIQVGVDYFVSVISNFDTMTSGDKREAIGKEIDRITEALNGKKDTFLFPDTCSFSIFENGLQVFPVESADQITVKPK